MKKKTEGTKAVILMLGLCLGALLAVLLNTTPQTNETEQNRIEETLQEEEVSPYEIRQKIEYNNSKTLNITHWTYRQDSGIILRTYVMKNDEYSYGDIIRSWKDVVTIETAADIKCDRWCEAEQLIINLEYIDEISCHE